MHMVRNCLFQWRTKLGYRFATEFAEEAGVKYGSYVQWEKNEVEITLSSLKTLRDFIQTKVKDEKIYIDDLLILDDE